MQPSRLIPAFLALALTAHAQGPRANPSITASHIHLNSADIPAATRFWVDVVGLSASKRDNSAAVSTLGVTLLLAAKAPTGPSAGSAIDSIAFKVPDVDVVAGRLARTPFKSSKPQGDGPDRLIIDGPDGVRVELIEDSNMYAAVEFVHIRLNAKDPKQTRAWYAQNLGARPGMRGDADSIGIPGASLTIVQSDNIAPSIGRAIDHISFEVKDIQALAKTLAANGVKLDSGPEPEPALGAIVAWLTDPSGARLGLEQKTAQ